METTIHRSVRLFALRNLSREVVKPRIRGVAAAIAEERTVGRLIVPANGPDHILEGVGDFVVGIRRGQARRTVGVTIVSVGDRVDVLRDVGDVEEVVLEYPDVVRVRRQSEPARVDEGIVPRLDRGETGPVRQGDERFDEQRVGGVERATIGENDPRPNRASGALVALPFSVRIVQSVACPHEGLAFSCTEE